MFLKIFVALSILHATSCSSDDSNSPPIVTTRLGKLQGTYIESAFLKRQAAAFYGVPYAKPPVGERRFKEPERADPWNGTLIANVTSPQCYQMDITNTNRNTTAGSEDCLYMNIFTPKLPGNNSKLMDVIFYIHGGGFVFFSPNYLGFERLMDEDVVVAAVTYRLGALGFLSTEDEVVPGNNGLKDQNMALRWVKDNIQYFGGDPNKITLAGFSAGAASVQYHMASPMSRGLFKRAILESGSALDRWAFKKNPRREAEKLARSLNCTTETSKAMVDCLREQSASDLVYDPELDAFNLYTDFYFVPCVEPPSRKAFLTKPVESIILSGESADIPVLMGFTRDEGLTFSKKYIVNSTLYEQIDKNWTDVITDFFSYPYPKWSEKQEEITTALRQYYIGDNPINENYVGLVRMFSDWGFIGGIEQSAKLFARVNKSPVNVFRFNYNGTITPLSDPIPGNVFEGIGHTEETQYTIPFFGHQIPEDEAMSPAMVNTWMSFIKGRRFNKKWKTMKEVIPKFGFLDVKQPQWYENEFVEFDDFTSYGFWESITGGSYEQ